MKNKNNNNVTELTKDTKEIISIIYSKQTKPDELNALGNDNDNDNDDSNDDSNDGDSNDTDSSHSDPDLASLTSDFSPLNILMSLDNVDYSTPPLSGLSDIDIQFYCNHALDILLLPSDFYSISNVSDMYLVSPQTVIDAVQRNQKFLAEKDHLLGLVDTETNTFNFIFNRESVIDMCMFLPNSPLCSIVLDCLYQILCGTEIDDIDIDTDTNNCN